MIAQGGLRLALGGRRIVCCSSSSVQTPRVRGTMEFRRAS